MANKFPKAFKQFVEVCNILENHYHDMQDMEFTVEHGKLYMLQTRNGKRTAPAAPSVCPLHASLLRRPQSTLPSNFHQSPRHSRGDTESNIEGGTYAFM